jgi:hypothetical protein
MHRHLFSILMIAAAATLQGCRTTETEQRFLHDYKAVTELADTLSEHAPRGFEFSFTNTLSAPPHADFQTVERNIRDYMHSSGGWQGNSFRQAVYRPVTTQAVETNPPNDSAVLLEQYFGKLERVGFTSGEVGFSKTAALGSMDVARKSWANRDRTLIVLGEMIVNRESGEIIASVHYWGTLNYRAH